MLSIVLADVHGSSPPMTQGSSPLSVEAGTVHAVRSAIQGGIATGPNFLSPIGGDGVSVPAGASFTADSCTLLGGGALYQGPITYGVFGGSPAAPVNSGPATTGLVSLPSITSVATTHPSGEVLANLPIYAQ